MHWKYLLGDDSRLGELFCVTFDDGEMVVSIIL